jgi:DNA-binding transcriptional MocR family regulator
VTSRLRHEIGGGVYRFRVALRLLTIGVALGECWPSAETIAVDLGISSRTVRRETQKLRDQGLLAWEHGATFDGKQSSNEYDLSSLAAKVTEILNTVRSVLGRAFGRTPEPDGRAREVERRGGYLVRRSPAILVMP